MSRLDLTIRRAAAALSAGRRGRLALDSPQRILQGPNVHHGRVFLADVGAMWAARRAAGPTGHGIVELWLRGAPIVYELDERAEVRVEFGNGLVLMAAARRDGGTMRLTPMRRELEPLDLALDPQHDRREPGR